MTTHSLSGYLEELRGTELCKKIEFMLNEIDDVDIEHGHTMTWFLSIEEFRQLSIIQPAFLIICPTATFEIKTHYWRDGILRQDMDFHDDDCVQIMFRVFFNGPVRIDQEAASTSPA